MHQTLAAIYHKVLHLVVLPSWRPPAAAFVAALVLRLLGPGRAGLSAGLAVLAGWLALILPGPLWPEPPVARLPGLALLLIAYGLVGARLGRAALPLFAAIAAWWLHGAPLGGSEFAGIVPIFLGLLAAAAIVRRIAANDTGWTSIAAAASLAASIALAGGAMHWARAALVPATAGLALLGLTEAVAPLQLATILVATAAVVASNRGRFIPIDAAAAAPLLVWWLAPRLQPRLNQAGPALAGTLAAVGCVAVVWASIMLLAHR